VATLVEFQFDHWIAIKVTCDDTQGDAGNNVTCQSVIYLARSLEQYNHEVRITTKAENIHSHSHEGNAIFRNSRLLNVREVSTERSGEPAIGILHYLPKDQSGIVFEK
jgi:hypothetical protein